jgi:hypothetical protein
MSSVTSILAARSRKRCVNPRTEFRSHSKFELLPICHLPTSKLRLCWVATARPPPTQGAIMESFIVRIYRAARAKRRAPQLIGTVENAAGGRARAFHTVKELGTLLARAPRKPR